MDLIEMITGRPKRFDEERLRDELSRANITIDSFKEMIAELELPNVPQLNEPGWVSLTSLGIGDDQFSKPFLDAIAHTVRVYARKNPLVKRGIGVRTAYTWGQGISITAGSPPVNEVVQRFLTANGNLRSVTGPTAQERCHRTLETSGNVFFRFFVNQSTGAVKVRTVPLQQIPEKYKDPDDNDTVWFYRRKWRQNGAERDELYPDISYRPKAKPAKYKGVPVRWDTPMYQIRTDDFVGDDFGVPTAYAAIDWARAYKEVLEQWKKLITSLSRWAWKMTTGSKSQTAVANAAERIAQTFGTDDTGRESNPAPNTGSVKVTGDGVGFDPINTKNAAYSIEDGRRMLLMVAAAFGLPETFFGDADVGNHATSTTLDRPTELTFLGLQRIWGEGYRDIIGFVIDCSARAVNGLLHRYNAGEDEELGFVILEGDDDDGNAVSRDVDIDWPPILQREPKDLVDALVKLITLDGKKPVVLNDLKTVLRLGLTYLGEEDIDAIMARFFPPEGEEPEAVPIDAPDAAEEATGQDSAAMNERLAGALERFTTVLRQ